MKPSLKECWESGYQVILSYDDRSFEDPVLWPRIGYWWADNSDPKEVISFLNNKKQTGRPGEFKRLKKNNSLSLKSLFQGGLILLLEG